MDFSDPVSDYIRKSILTAQGDIVVRGASQPAKLAIGSAGQILQVNSGATGLEYVNSFTFDPIEEQSLASHTNISANPTIFTSALKAVTAGEIYEANFRGKLYTPTGGYCNLTLTSSGSNTATISQDGASASTTITYNEIINFPYTAYTRFVVRYRLEVTVSGNMQLLFKVDSTSGSGIIEAGGETAYYLCQLK